MMGCCLVAALLVSLVRKAWFGLSGRTPVPAPFPPPARRAAPGAHPTPARPTGHAVGPDLTRPRLAPPAAAAVVTLAYAALTALTTATGLAASATDPLVGGFVRDVVLAGVLVVLLALAARSRPVPRPAREQTGRCLVAAGLVWTALLVLDLHLLGHALPTSTVLDVALHAAAVVGLWAGLLLWRPLERRPVTRTEGIPA
jgi:hypothetical protein